MTASVLLIHPPVAKPCEPPAGIARLAGACRAHGIRCRVWDAALGSVLHLLSGPIEVPGQALDTWSRRAIAKTPAHLEALRTWELYRNPDRYRTAVHDINRALQVAGGARNQPGADKISLTLADYRAARRSAVRSADLLDAAQGYADNPLHAYFQQRLASYLEEETPGLVGISLNFMSQALCAFALAGLVRALLPGVRLVLGGGLVTSWMRIPGFANPFTGLVDDLVEGPGESVLPEMAGDGPSPAGNAAAGSFDFAEFPLGRYLAPGPVVPYPASRGCYWRRCAFCPEKSECSNYEPRSPQAVTADLKGILKTPAALIHFLDNALAPRVLKQLIAHPPGVPWYGFVRFTRHLADPDFVRGLKAAGCVMLKLGVESGSQRVLDALDKGIDLGLVSRGLRTLRAAGIATYVYLLFGTPAETVDDARQTLDFTRNHGDCIDFLNLAIFNLPAHCPEARELKTREFYPGDLSLYREFIHPRGWNRDRVRRFLSKEFRSAPAIRAILQRDPPFFTSNHAPFLCM